MWFLPALRQALRLAQGSLRIDGSMVLQYFSVFGFALAERKAKNNKK